MSPTQFAEEMRQARLRSPLRTRESALRQFAEVQASLHRQNLLPGSKPSGSTPPKFSDHRE